MRWVAAFLLCCALPGAAQQECRKPSSAYKDGRTITPSFEGPGRDLPEPEGLSEVRIGYFGPSDALHPEGGAIWQGATLAVEEANREGGYKGKPFRLMPGWSENPWRAGASHVARMAFKENVWAVVGGIEGAGTHLAEQVVAKALLTLVNPVATDRSIHMAGVPWMFSVVQGDDLHAAMLASALHGRSVAILSATDHDSRAFAGNLKTAFAGERVNIRLHLEFDPGRPDLSETARSASDAQAEAVVVIAAARDSARAVKALRQANFTGLIAGGPWFGRALFARQARTAADGVLFPWVGPPAPAFRDRFDARFGGQPDYAAACAYDSIRIVIAAIREAGLNRARIRDAIAAMAPYEGASGHIEWDEFGQNRRPPALAAIQSGQPLAVSSKRPEPLRE